MLTAKSSEIDRVLGLELGADDYLTKPFSMLELAARVKGVFRRAEQQAQAKAAGEQATQQVIEHLDLHIDLQRHEVQLRGKALELTAKEFELLVYFARSPGRVFTRAQLLTRSGATATAATNTPSTRISIACAARSNPTRPTPSTCKPSGAWATSFATSQPEGSRHDGFAPRPADHGGA